MSHIYLIIFKILLAHTQENIYLLILIKLWILNSLNRFFYGFIKFYQCLCMCAIFIYIFQTIVQFEKKKLK